MKKVLVLGGYGNFGSIISRRLAKDGRFNIIVAGRSQQKAQDFAKLLSNVYKGSHTYAAFDAFKDMKENLQKINPDYVIHTCGPFQGQNYAVAQSCIEKSIPYIDLADGRQFVKNFQSLNQKALKNKALAITGASSVPALSAAIIDKYQSHFQRLQKINYGISTAQWTNPGIVTIAGVFSYTGKSFKTLINGKMTDVIGWQDFHAQRYKKFGWRLFGNCQIPDLDLFRKRYPTIHTIRFYAGTQLFFNQIGIWLLSWLVKVGLISNLPSYAPFFHDCAQYLDMFGTGTGGMHLQMQGKGDQGQNKIIRFQVSAFQNNGPVIPCIPAILLTKMLADGKINKIGAIPCLDLIKLQDYINQFREMDLNIQTDVYF